MSLRIQCAMRVLTLNLRPEALAATTRALDGQGYEVVVENGLTVDQVLALSPEVLVTEASLPTSIAVLSSRSSSHVQKPNHRSRSLLSWKGARWNVRGP